MKLITRLRIIFYDLVGRYHLHMMCRYSDYPLISDYHDKKYDYYWDKCIELSAKYGDGE